MPQIKATLDANTLARLISRSFSTGSRTRGLSLSASGAVLNLDFDMDKLEIRSAVQGTAPEPYQQHITFSENAQNLKICHCSCPVTHDCKHAAAVLWALASAYRRGEEPPGTNLETPKSIPAEKPGPDSFYLSTPLKESLTILVEALKGKEENRLELGPIAAKRAVILYAVSENKAGEIEIQALETNIRKDGSYGKTTSVSPRYLSDHDASFIDDQDRTIARLWSSASSSIGYLWSGLPEDRNTRMAILTRVINTGRAYWPNPWGKLLKLGTNLTGSLIWVKGRDYMNHLTPACPERLDLKYFRGNCTGLYLDVKEGLLGEVVFTPALSKKMLDVIARLPGARDIELPAVQYMLDSLGAPSYVLRPRSDKETETRIIKPKAKLLVSSRPMPKAAQGLRKLGKRLDYAHLSITTPEAFTNGRTTRIINTPDKTIIEKLDVDFAETCLKRLYELGLKEIETPWQFGLSSLGKYLGMDDDLEWARFLAHDLDLIDIDGLEVEVEKTFCFDRGEGNGEGEGESAKKDWHVISRGRTDFWFKLDLGIEVGNEIVSILPVLETALNHLGDEPDLSDLDRFNIDGKFHCRLENGDLIALPFARVRNILAIVLQLYDKNLTFEDEALSLNFSQAATLIAEQNLNLTRFAGAERLKTIAAKLNDYRGLAAVDPPQQFKAQLRDYQATGLSWLQFLSAYGLGGILADDMGLGKTVQALAHIALEKESGRMQAPFLVVCPTTVLPNWLDEAAKFTPQLKAIALRGGERKAYYKHLDNFDIVLTTYQIMLRDVKLLEHCTFHGIILDEAQAIKTAQAQTKQAASRLSAKHKICLTGTPVENNLGELWSQFDFLMPGLLGTNKQFNQHFRIPIEKKREAGKKELLAKLISPFLVRRTKDLVAKELPPKTTVVQTIELTGDQRDIYESVRNAMHVRVRDSIEEKGINKSQIVILEAMLRLRQACCHPQLLPVETAKQAGSAKLEALMELLGTLLAEERRVLIFTQFTSMMDLIAERLKQNSIEYVEIRGSTEDRKTPVAQFQTGSIPVFLISLKAGGTGLNLTAADTVIHYDPWWNPAVEDQATDRAHRIGQEKPVFVYKLVAAETIEERMKDLQEQKRALYQAILDGDNNATVSFTQTDLELLFKPLTHQLR